MRLTGLEAVPQAAHKRAASGHEVHPHLLRGVAVERPDQVWCADITCIPVRSGFLYLVAAMDWATRFVLAWRLSNTMDAAFQARKPPGGNCHDHPPMIPDQPLPGSLLVGQDDMCICARLRHVAGIVINNSSYHYSGNEGGPERLTSIDEIEREAKENDWHIFRQQLPLSRGFPKIMRGNFSHPGDAVLFPSFAREFFKHIGLDG